ncbi:RND family transporter [Filobacillus milosensis]|uniref:RND family transporter n=1 Tax=Filobacillus milosensis TaxID=94137 RepID=A0A4Y8IF69_9BACI|nr:MMPL family transporter [Filobacillus milosensis]TFB13470.1 RND family transporter [Filobacillus milosensis]
MIITIISAVAQFGVSVNHNMVDYLPEDTPSMEATNLMEEEFDQPIMNARVMLHDVLITEATTYKQQLEQIDGVSNVMWLDDVLDLKRPLEMANRDTVESYYQNQNALFSVHISEGDEVEAIDEIYQLFGNQVAITGDALDTATSQKMAGNETMYAAALLIPIIIIILVLSTTSWVEPVFFLTAIGVSVLINMGTNIFLGEISFITQSVAPILQLAVSLDYAIFLLHSFADYRKQESDPKAAMKLAMNQSFPAIIASASTTFFGFMALSFMEFGIGADLGINLVKGIALSFLSVMIFLPALTLLFYKWIDRTQHRPIVPEYKNIGKRVIKLRFPVFLLVVLMIVPAFLAQNHTSFLYGFGDQPDHTRAGSDQIAIEEEFGKNTPMVVLVPNGDMAKEEELVQQLENINHISSVISYVNTVSPAIPTNFLDESLTEQFYSDEYSRITLHTNTEPEGEVAFSLVEDVRETSETYYDDVHLLGKTVTLYDMKNVVEQDNTLVNILTVVTIAIVLLLTFRSLSIPVVLLLTIQSAVWLNLSVPYFTDTPLVYVGYLIISTVQLAATVDYGILFTEYYMKIRRDMPALQAIKKTINHKTFSIFISASILSSVGFILGITSTNPIVSSIGMLLGRGALLAFILVVFFLPAMLLIFDKVIERTTLKANFYKGE